MKLIETIKWIGNKQAVALVYAKDATMLGRWLGDLELIEGSMGYVANGNVYIFNGSSWTKVGA